MQDHSEDHPMGKGTCRFGFGRSDDRGNIPPWFEDHSTEALRAEDAKKG